MGYRAKVKVRRQGGSLVVTIPKEWLDFWGIKEGDEVIELGNAILILTPKHLEEKARKLLYPAQD